MEIPAKQKNILLKLAANTIEEYITKQEIIKKPAYLNCKNLFFAKVMPQIFKEKLNCFVTIYKDSVLRGCIGSLRTDESLYQNIIKYSILAATQDGRFSPVSVDELAFLKYEISILAKFVEISDSEDFLLGEEGLLLNANLTSAILLPQVATECSLNKLEFIETLKEKARLTEFKHRVNYKLYKFKTTIIK